MDKPIGVFDSGVGGLTVMKEIIRLLPDEDIVYLGDTARVPYGTKSKETILKFAVEDTLFLLKLDVKLVIVACNTVSSTNLDTIDRYFDIPMVGVIEGSVHKATKISRRKIIGVIGTKATIKSDAYCKKIKTLDNKIKVFSISCPLFVSFVEEGMCQGKAIEDIAKNYLGPLKNKIDILILGCTHYPLLSGVIRSVMGKDVLLVDSAKETAIDTKNTLSRLKILSSKKKRPNYRFFVTDEPKTFKELGKRFLGRNINKVEKVSI